MTRTALLFTLTLAACEIPAPAPPAAVATERAPAVQVPTVDGPVDLAALAGRPVVVQFATADDADAWAALGDALGDLEAAGATVLAVTVDGAEAEAAKAFGYTGAPLAVVVDGEGVLRGRAQPLSGDALFSLAAPVLAEADIAATVEWKGAETLDALLSAGGLVIDVSETPSGRGALQIAADTLTAQDLPADLGTPIAFVGEDADMAADAAAGWGYASVFVAEADGTLDAVEAPPPPSFRPSGRRGRGVRG